MKNRTLLALAYSLLLPAAAAAQLIPSTIHREEAVVPERRTLESALIPSFTGQVMGESALEADFEPTPQTGCDPMTVTFIDRSSGNPNSWQWDVDNDGTVDGTTPQFTYTYQTPGTYTVRLTVRDASGASATATKEPYRVLPAIVAHAGNDTTICSGSEIPLGFELPQGSGDPIIEWDPQLFLSDPASSHPTAFPEETITYVMTINNVGGCIMRDTVTITVNPLPAFPEITRDGNTLTSSVDAALYRWYRDGVLQFESPNAKSYTPTANGSYTVQVLNSAGCSNTSQTFNFVLQGAGVDRELAVMNVRVLPNPFKEITTLEYDLPRTSQVQASLYDLLGRKLVTLVDERQNSGPHTIGIGGELLAPGIYICRLTVGDITYARAIVRKQ